MQDAALLDVLNEVATAVRAALDGLADWGEAGTRSGQYRSDLAADEAALAVLERAGVGVLSEESGLTHVDRDVVVVIDPVDGSTNASRDLPWYATSLCALDADGPWVALVVDQSSGARFEAVRGGGARVDGRPLRPTGCTELAGIGTADLPLEVSAIDSYPSVTDAPERSLTIVARVEVSLAQVFNGKEQLCDILDRCGDVSHHLLDRAPAWLGEDL
jgi:fructose-1,6-bisphosphatase/inositol monophosphatase family enzyme